MQNSCLFTKIISNMTYEKTKYNHFSKLEIKNLDCLIIELKKYDLMENRYWKIVWC